MDASDCAPSLRRTLSLNPFGYSLNRKRFTWLTSFSQAIAQGLRILAIFENSSWSIPC